MEEEKKRQLIEFISLEKGEKLDLFWEDSKIVFVVCGKVNISSPLLYSKKMIERKMLFVPVLHKIEIDPIEKSDIISISVTDGFGVFDSLYPIDSYGDMACQHETSILSMNAGIYAYAYSLQMYGMQGSVDDDFSILKIKELSLVMKNFYSREELQFFFKTYLTNNLCFSEQVRSHLAYIKTVRQLAERMNYSYSGFNKRFRKTFGMSAYSWLRQQKTNVICHDICYTNKSLKQISAENKFTSLSHFNEFCHKVLGDSPRKIRSRRRQQQNI
ncbi:AraC family transcriptional regulator [Dysgonomonas sp. 520]|uniref:helix-turn-helix domain-containing protein n=1 Tax=Dysgonomonas sp. 520 TaxID=2302931 RepID=UPI0013CFE90B|nr:AraC family transcriptional regulator [Dysgonomonas sp. 520]NDW09608.1 AraC family transcriptional regulator [Dysgonomonas sp. 520]